MTLPNGSNGKAFDYKLDDVEPPDVEAVGRACAQFRSVGLKAD